jgi:ornithine carbamoyltransferase
MAAIDMNAHPSSNPPADAFDALEATASSLRTDARAGASPTPLRGRNIGVVCEDPLRPEVYLLERTASRLGARVALLRPGLEDGDARHESERTGRVLGRLYDALVCVDVAPSRVQALREASGIPAAADLAGRWVALHARCPGAQEDDRYLLQALLIEACG